MAYVARQLSDDETKNKSLIDLGDAAAGDSSGTSSSGSSPVGAPEASSGTFVGIGDYLKANAGGAEQLGQQVSGLINQNVTNATNTINQGAQQFANAAQQNQTVYNQQAVNDTINRGAATDEFAKLASGSYSGPKTLADVGAQSQIDSAILNAQQKAQLAGNTGGRAELLREVLNRPSTVGSSNLNSALLNGSQAGSQAVTAAAKNVDPLTGQMSAAQQNAAYTASQVAERNKQTGQQAIGAIGGYLSQQDQALAQQAAQLQAQQTARAQAAQAYLAQLNQAAAAGVGTANNGREQKAMVNPNAVAPGGFEQAGLTSDQAAQLYNLARTNAKYSGSAVDLGQFYNAPVQSGLNASNVLSQQEAARLNGLAAIAGRNGYSVSNQNLDGSLNFGAAYNTLQGSVQQAQQQEAVRQAEAAAQAEANRVAAEAAAQAERDRLAAEQAAANAKKNAMDPVSKAISKVNPVLGKVTNTVTKTVKKLTKCVMATALVENGTWEEEKRNVLVDWCERTLHNNPIGEALRRGYQVICSKFTVPSVRNKGKLAPYFTWSFEQATGLLGKGSYVWYSVPNTVIWVSAMVITGAFVSKAYATKCWTSLYE